MNLHHYQQQLSELYRPFFLKGTAIEPVMAISLLDQADELNVQAIGYGIDIHSHRTDMRDVFDSFLKYPEVPLEVIERILKHAPDVVYDLNFQWLREAYQPLYEAALTSILRNFDVDSAHRNLAYLDSLPIAWNLDLYSNMLVMVMGELTACGIKKIDVSTYHSVALLISKAIIESGKQPKVNIRPLLDGADHFFRNGAENSFLIDPNALRAWLAGPFKDLLPVMGDILLLNHGAADLEVSLMDTEAILPLDFWQRNWEDRPPKFRVWLARSAAVHHLHTGAEVPMIKVLDGLTAENVKREIDHCAMLSHYHYSRGIRNDARATEFVKAYLAHCVEKNMVVGGVNNLTRMGLPNSILKTKGNARYFLDLEMDY